MELMMWVDRMSQSHHILETPISLDSGIKRYAISFVGIVKRTFRLAVKNQFPDGGPPMMFLSIVEQMGHLPSRVFPES
jgi:hypothetical protein